MQKTDYSIIKLAQSLTTRLKMSLTLINQLCNFTIGGKPVCTVADYDEDTIFDDEEFASYNGSFFMTLQDGPYGKQALFTQQQVNPDGDGVRYEADPSKWIF